MYNLKGKIALKCKLREQFLSVFLTAEVPLLKKHSVGFNKYSLDDQLNLWVEILLTNQNINAYVLQK